MRTPTITTPLDDSCDPAGWRAEAVAHRGWLSGAGSASTVPQITAEPAETSARAERTTPRTARRSASARRRRVRARTAQRSLLVERAGVNRVLKRPTLESQDVRAVQSLAPVDERQSEGYRMGRWARLALTLTVLAAVAVVTMSLVGSAPRQMVDVTVGPGDTLWSIATHAAPDRDPRDVIEEIKALNAVPGGVLPVGVVLRVPASTG